MAKSWTQADLIKAIHQRTTLSHPHCVKAIKCILALIKTGLKRDGEVKIHEFATFKVHPQSARMGRNPKTLEPKVIKAHNLVLLRRSKTLDKKFNL